MSVNEYAIDVNLSVDKIISLCQKLGVQVNDGEDMLDDDAIIMLDNEIANLDNEDVVEETEEFEDEEVLDEEVEDELETEYEEVKKETKPNNNKKGMTKSNSSKKVNKKADFEKQRKEMYKHKDKLKANVVELDESVILYKEGMTVSDFANDLGLGVGEVI